MEQYKPLEGRITALEKGLEKKTAKIAQAVDARDMWCQIVEHWKQEQTNMERDLAELRERKRQQELAASTTSSASPQEPQTRNQLQLVGNMLMGLVTAIQQDNPVLVKGHLDNIATKLPDIIKQAGDQSSTVHTVAEDGYESTRFKTPIGRKRLSSLSPPLTGRFVPSPTSGAPTPKGRLSIRSINKRKTPRTARSKPATTSDVDYIPSTQHEMLLDGLASAEEEQEEMDSITTGDVTRLFHQITTSKEA